MDDENEAPERGARLQFAAIAAMAITISCVLIGQAAQQLAATMAPAAALPSEVAAKASSPRFNAIDYATTAAIKGGTVIIGPCDAQKSGH